jgi:hypothetical protein
LRIGVDRALHNIKSRHHAVVLVLQIVAVDEVSSFVSDKPDQECDFFGLVNSDRVLPSPLVRQRWISVSLQNLKVDQMDVHRMYEAKQSEKLLVLNVPYFEITVAGDTIGTSGSKSLPLMCQLTIGGKPEGVAEKMNSRVRTAAFRLGATKSPSRDGTELSSRSVRTTSKRMI